MKKKILALVLSLSMLVSFLPASMITVSAEEVAGGTCGDNLTWTLDSEGILTISGTGDMYDWNSYDAPWSSFSGDFYKVVIEDGVTGIGDSAFRNCSRLKSITIPNSVTYIKDYAFECCGELKSIIIPDSVTSIGYYAFYCCDNLTNIYYSGTEEDWNNITGNGVEIYNSAIYYPEATGACGDNLTWVFYSDATLIISGTGDMTDWSGYAAPWSSFSGDIYKVIIEDGVTGVGDYAFYDYYNILSLTLPKSIIKIGDFAFHHCNISEVYYGGTEEDWKKIAIGELNEYLTNTTIYYAAIITGTCGDNLTWALDGKGTLTITGTGDWFNGEAPWYWIREDIYRAVIEDGVTNIGDCAFSDCVGLSSITIPDSVTSIGMHAFSNCTGLSSITIPDGVTGIGMGAFDSCSGLTDIVIPYGVTNIGDYAFCGCSGLTSVTIPDSVTSIGECAFSLCFELTDITIPNSVISIGAHAFSESGLTTISISDSVTDISENTFTNCQELTDINVDVNNPAYTSVDGILFNKDKTELLRFPAGKTETTYEIPAGVTCIGKNAFSGCTKLISVTILDGVTDISAWAFMVCRELTSIVIPVSVTDIGDFAFLYCDNLTDVYYGGTEEEWNKIAGTLGEDNACLTNATIHYAELSPEEKVAEDKAALDLGDTSAVVSNLTLPTVGSVRNSTITWETSDSSVITNTGEITRGDVDKTVTLTATISQGTEASDTKVFTVTVVGEEPIIRTETIDFTSAENIAYGKALTHIIGFYYSSGPAPSASRQYATDGDINTFHSGYGKVSGETTGVVFSIDLGKEYNLEDITMFLSNTNRSYKVYMGTAVDENNLLLAATSNATSTIVNGKEIYKSSGTFPADTTAQYLTICSPSGYGFPYHEIYITGTEVDDPSPGVVTGDANGDGEVDFADAIVVLKHDAGVSTLANDKLIAADTNGDGEVDFVDAIQILKYDSGLISSFS